MRNVIQRQLAKGEVLAGLDDKGRLIIILATKTALGDLHARIKLSRPESVSGSADNLVERVSYAQDSLVGNVDNYRRNIESILLALPSHMGTALRTPTLRLAAARLGNSHAQDDIVGALQLNPSVTRTLLRKGSSLLELVPQPSLDDIYGGIENPAFTRKSDIDSWVNYYLMLGASRDSVSGACCASCAARKTCEGVRR